MGKKDDADIFLFEVPVTSGRVSEWYLGDHSDRPLLSHRVGHHHLHRRHHPQEIDTKMILTDKILTLRGSDYD